MKNINVKIVGIGESGTRAVSRMKSCGVGRQISAGYVCIGKDENILLTSSTRENVYLNRDGATIHKKLDEVLAGANLILIVTGLGSDAARRAIPLIKSHARQKHASTVIFANLPSKLESKIRHENAAQCLKELVKIDTRFIVSSENLFLFRLNRKEITLPELFTVADEIFCDGAANFLDALIAETELTLHEFVFGNAIFCYGESEGNENVTGAIRNALKFPLVTDDALRLARKVFVRVTGGDLFFKSSADTAKTFVKEQFPEVASILWRVDRDSTLTDKIRAFLAITA